MASPKANYTSYTGVFSSEKAREIRQELVQALPKVVFDNLASYIGVKKEDRTAFEEKIIEITVFYRLNEANKAPSRGSVKAAIKDLSTLAKELHVKLEEADIYTAGIIAQKLGEQPPEAFESDLVHKEYMRGYGSGIEKLKLIKGHLEILSTALQESEKVKFDKKDGPDKSGIKHYIDEIGQVAQCYRTLPLKITITKEPLENINGNLADFIHCLLSAVIGARYKQLLSLGGIRDALVKYKDEKHNS